METDDWLTLMLNNVRACIASIHPDPEVAFHKVLGYLIHSSCLTMKRNDPNEMVKHYLELGKKIYPS